MSNHEAPLKFRCHGCGQLLGVPPSRAGRATRCPKCAVELIVPAADPLVAPAPAIAQLDVRDPDPDATPFELGELRSEDLRILAGSDIDFLRRATNSPTDPSGLHAVAPAASPWSPPGEPIRRAPSPPSSNPRGRDVLLPRSVVLAWMLLALLAIGFAFLSGFLIGRVGLPGIKIRSSTPPIQATPSQPL